MKSWDGLTLAILALLSDNAMLVLAQYVTTVTISINDNPFCTPMSGITYGNISAIPGTTGGGVGGPVYESALGSLNGSASSTGSAIISSPTAVPTVTSSGQHQALGYYPAPADGNLLGGPVFTNPAMTTELCASDCQQFPYFALENGDECNCGMSAPSGTPSPSPLSKNKRQISAIGCIPCAGNSNECCGAPGGYALVYHNTPDVDSSAGSVITASYTSYSSLSATSVIAYTSSSVTEASFTSYSSISASSFVPDTSSSTITSTSSSSAEPTNYFTPLTLTYDSATGSISSITFDTSTSLAASSTIVSTSSNTIISTSSSIAESNSDFAPSTLTYNSTTGSTSTVTFVTPTTFAPITSAPISSSSASGNSSSGSFNSSTYSSSFGTGSGTGFAFSPSPSSFAPYPSQTLFNTSVYSTAAISSSRSASYSSQTEYPPPATPSSSSAPNTSMNPTTAAPSSSSTPGLSIAGAQGSNSDATTTTNGSATATSSGGPEPTVESPTPSCVQAANYTGNNTIYNDYFGFTYDIRCNLDLQSTPTDHDAYAGSFEECLEYCSLLTDCVAVTYEDPASPPQNLSNCYPKWDFGGYTASSTDGLYSGVDVNGPSPGTLENQDLCTTNNEQDSSYDGQTYYDDFGQAWAIGCNNTVAIASSEALYPTVADTLASCIDYCSVYEACNALNWLGPHTNGTTNDPNCFPASSNETAGAAGSAPGSGYAVLVPF